MKLSPVLGACASLLILAAANPARPAAGPAADLVLEAKKEGAERLARALVNMAAAMREFMFRHQDVIRTDSCPDSQPKDPGDGHSCVKDKLLPGAVSYHVLSAASKGRDYTIREALPSVKESGMDSWERRVFERFRKDRAREGAEFGEFVEKDKSLTYRVARPIVMKAACLVCHEGPVGEPDPYFPRHKMEGYKLGEVAGIVSAAVPVR